MKKARISAIGSYVPEQVLTNAQLEQMVDTSNEWICARTGIRERRLAADNQDTSDLIVPAALKALEGAGKTVDDIDLCIVGTVTPDFRLPSASCIVQKKMRLFNAATMDVVAACAGFIHGLSISQAYIATDMFKCILLIGAEKLSTVTNYEDRNTCILFGDGAGAAVIEPSDDGRGILATYLHSDGRLDELLNIPAGGAHLPYGRNGHHDSALHFIHMQGNEVFKHAVRHMGDSAQRVLDLAGLTIADVDLLVPHQANIRIIQATAKRLGMPWEKVFMNIDKVGNTSAASIPLALDDAVHSGRLKQGDVVLSAAFGGGLTWGASLIRW